jgi:hypothetical protein
VRRQDGSRALSKVITINGLHDKSRGATRAKLPKGQLLSTGRGLDALRRAVLQTLGSGSYSPMRRPPSYKGSAFVTFHGSWNRAPRTGYEVFRLLFDSEGKPTGEYEDFMTGFVMSDTQVWGRPVGVTVGHDGSLFVTEDGNGTVWRVAYTHLSTPQKLR